MVELAREFNLLPWDLNRLTVQQFNAFCDAIETSARNHSG